MQKTTLKLSQFLAGALLSLALAPLNGSVAQAQQVEKKPISLLEAVCVSTGPGRWRPLTEDVAVGRQVYTALLFMGPGTQYSAMTCRIRPENPGPNDYNFQTLLLQFGMRDNDWKSPPATVQVYLDGKLTADQTVRPGERALLSIPITNVSNISIETICTSESKYCDRVYFFEAALDPILPPPTDMTAPAPQVVPPPSTTVPVPPPPSRGGKAVPPPPPRR